MHGFKSMISRVAQAILQHVEQSSVHLRRSAYNYPVAAWRRVAISATALVFPNRLCERVLWRLAPYSMVG